MRVVRLFISTFFIFLIILNKAFVGVAMNTDFTTDVLNKNETEEICDHVNISIIKAEPPKKSISCFSVNADGKIAIGCSNSADKSVCIYSTDGTFQYGYKFSCNGSFGIELHGNVLNIYFVRGNIALSVNDSGEVVEARRIRNSIENNSYWDKHIFCKRQKVGDTEYVIKNDMGILNLIAVSYSQLAVIDSNGNENIIYDVNSMQLLRIIISIICVFTFVCIIVTVVIRQIVKSYHG